MSPRYYSSSRHQLFQVESTSEANKRDLQVCTSALKKLSEDERVLIEECVMDLTGIGRNIGVDSALCLIGAIGRYFATHPEEFEARINATKV